jgi:hypothetical protein
MPNNSRTNFIVEKQTSLLQKRGFVVRGYVREYYLTIGFKDELDKDQVAVIEMGKDIVRATLPIVETRSGKKIEYQDEEAKKSR